MGPHDADRPSSLAVRQLVVLIAALLIASMPRAVAGAPVPAVFMHGISATSSSMDHPMALIQSQVNGVFVYSIKIYEDKVVDSEFIDMNRQVAWMAAELAAIPELADGFNLFCVSQGGQNCRGYIERYSGMRINETAAYPPVNIYISWVAVGNGIFGIPDGGILNPTVDKLVATTPYLPAVQESISFAGYWRDPFNQPAYLAGCQFMPDLNNELPVQNATYRANLMAVRHIVFLYSLVDTVLIPKETGWFETYATGSDTVVVPLNQTQLYQEDWIGLRAMYEAGQLTFATTTCEHQDYTSACFDQYATQWVTPLFELPFGAPVPASYPRGYPS